MKLPFCLVDGVLSLASLCSNAETGKEKEAERRGEEDRRKKGGGEGEGGMFPNIVTLRIRT
jgi:hypothetical protein